MPAEKTDWRTTATAIGGVVSVLLFAVGLFYTNDANRKQQQLGLDQQGLPFKGRSPTGSRPRLANWAKKARTSCLFA
jgi:hypothetical protein